MGPAGRDVRLLTMTVDPRGISERTRDVKRSDLKMLDDTPREDAGEVAEVGDGVAELLD